MEQVFSRHHEIRVYLGDPGQLPINNTHPDRTIFLLNHDDVDGLTTPISSILSTSFHSSSLTAYVKGQASLCAESHQFLRPCL